jgi:pimeloyl-ACP methyl ester carboxylesterase
MLMRMSSFDCTRAVVVSLAVSMPCSAALAQQTTPASFTIFIGGMPMGSEQIAVGRTVNGWSIGGSGRIGAPIDILSRQIQVRYDSNWKPLELTIDANVRGQELSIRSVANAGRITTEIVNAGQRTTSTTTTEAEIFLPNPFFAPYEALAFRLKTAAAGAVIPGYAPNQPLFFIHVGESSTERIQTATQLIDARATHVTLESEGLLPLDADIWADGDGRLLRLSIPAQTLDVVREDIGSVATRRVPISRPNDEQARIPSNGFSLIGTISKPPAAAAARLPAVVFVGGSGPTDRDEMTAGIPILGQLAGSVADAGFLTLRYDKRGVGQSGGRLESASLADLAEDVRSAVKMLSGRKDVDSKHIAVIGHSEGGAVALLAAADDKRIAAVGVIAANGVKGSDLILEQQQHLLSRSSLSEADKQARVAMQKQINEAVITGKGWDALPPETKRADNVEFQSLLLNDPAKVIPDVRQPILILHGDLDTQVAPINADRLDALSRRRKKQAAVDLVKIPGVNHLLLSATTGEVDEYPSLRDKRVSPAVVDAVTAWLKKTLR